MKDKIILVFYVGCKNIDICDIGEYMSYIARHFDKLKDSTVEMIYIPCREETDFRIECINPKMISEEEYSDVQKIVEEFKEKFNDIIKSIQNG